MTRLELIGLSKHFKAQARPAVDRINLEVKAGELVALLGPSGCGKTTTLKMIAGLLRPDAGDIRMDGKSVLDVPAEKRNTVMVFQQHALFPFMNVGDNVAFGLRVRGLGKKEIHRRVEEMLALVQLPGMSKRATDELSGGQQQRVALARALITRPKLLLLDEPLANLDAHLRYEMRSLILSLQRQTGVTTIVVTHDQEEAVMLADRIALMFDGHIAHYTVPMEFFHRPCSLRAARFFGGRNFLPSVREGTMAHTAMGDFELHPRYISLMPEGPGTLTIRPEHVTIETTSTGLDNGSRRTDGNRIIGRLASCIFLGTHTRCIVRSDEFEFEVLTKNDSSMLKEGMQLSLYLPPEHIWFFSEVKDM